MLFDDTNLYIATRAWDSVPESEWVVNEMRRDSFNVLQNDNLGFLIDTFYDRRNGIIFTINPIGGRRDGEAKTQTTGRSGQDTSYKSAFRYNGDRYGVTAEHLFVDAAFSPGVGFVRREDFRKSSGSLRPGGSRRERRRDVLRLSSRVHDQPQRCSSARWSSYNSSNNALSSNIRLRWEYQPGSELFIVYNDQRDTLVPRSLAQLESRVFIVSEPKAFDKKRLEE